MADRSPPGDGLTSRLMSRGGSGLHRRQMPDGGEVYSGPTAKRALRALGARAFTMDKSIFVDDDFDPSKPEDAALYAHESHHKDQSGGHNDGNDDEEREARAIERSVMQRTAAGEGLGSVMRDMKGGGGGGGGRGKKGGSKEEEKQDHAMANLAIAPNGCDPMEAYEDMINEGKNHMIIVRELSKYVTDTLMRLEEEHLFRTTDYDFF